LSRNNKLVVDVDYYNHEHERALKRIRGIRAGLDQIAGKSIEVPQGEFLTYSLFTHLGTGPDRFATKASIRRVANQYAQPLDDYFCRSGSVRLKDPAYDPHNGLRERIGVALGLSAVSRIHGMTLADWVRIPVMRTPHLDFHLGSDGERKIQVETKGTVVRDNTRKEPKVSLHASNIAEKKAHLKSLRSEPAQWRAGVRYGTIAAIDDSRCAKVWLLDPEPEPVMWEPQELRLLARFGFLAAWLRLISPYSRVSQAMRHRYEKLVNSRQPLSLDRVPLIDADGVTINGDRSGDVEVPGNFFYGKSDFDAKIVVRSIALDRRRQLMLGLRRELLDLVFTQDFSGIMAYRSQPSSLDGVLKSGPFTQSVEIPEGDVTLSQTSFGTTVNLVAA